MSARREQPPVARVADELWIGVGLLLGIAVTFARALEANGEVRRQAIRMRGRIEELEERAERNSGNVDGALDSLNEWKTRAQQAEAKARELQHEVNRLSTDRLARQEHEANGE